MMKRNYVILLVLLLIFLAPGPLAYFYYKHPNWLRGATTNRGELLTPTALFPSTNSQSKWRLVLWSPNDCESSCLTQLDKLARIRLALGRRLYSVELELVLKNQDKPLSDSLIKFLHEQDIHFLTLSQHDIDKQRMLLNEEKVFIVNSHHYSILAYTLTASPNDIYHDLKQLVTNE